MSKATDDTTLEVNIGDSALYPITVVNATAMPINITGYTFTLTVSNYNGMQLLQVPAVPGANAADDAPNGKVNIPVTVAQTTALGVGRFTYKLVMATVANASVTTLVTGEYVVI